MDINTLLDDYRPGDDVARLVRDTPIVLLVGITAAGKDTVKQALLASGKYHEFVSHTTRQPRKNHGIMEQDGVDYHFVSREDMAELLVNQQMIEAKQFSGNIYGTGVVDLQNAQTSGKTALNDIEVQGVREYKQLSSDVHAIFLLPPSYEVWRDRIRKRYGVDDMASDNMQLRLETAAVELRNALESGYFEFVVNDDLSQTVATVAAIVDGDDNIVRTDQGAQVAEHLLKDISTHID